MTGHPDADTAPAADDEGIVDFARTELGPASERQLRQPATLAAVHARLAAGESVADAALGEIHRLIETDRRLANEFAGHFLDDLMRTGNIAMAYSSRLRRFLDTGDLVLSVFGDMWGDLSTLHFQSRSQFRSLFAQRVHWKAADKARRLQNDRRREDRRVPQRPEDLELPVGDAAGAPLRHSIQAEDRDRLILLLLRLKQRDRQILTLHLRGEGVESIARALDLPSTEAARKALARAIEQARRLAEESDRRRPPPGAEPEGA